MTPGAPRIHCMSVASDTTEAGDPSAFREMEAYSKFGNVDWQAPYLRVISYLYDVAVSDTGRMEYATMAEHMILISKKEQITVVPPMNGEATWLRILYGPGADQVHIDREAAKQLRDGLTQALAELDEIEQAGPTKDQRKPVALKIIKSRAMGALSPRTQKSINNQLADIAPESSAT